MIAVQARQCGFTLLEVLIAITITALIGIGSSQLLSSAINTNDQTQARLKELQELQKTVLLMSRDFQQLVPRSVRDEYGDFQSAVRSSNESYKIEFSRTGWRNPLADPRSDIQRVAYELREGELIRHYWQVLDRSQDSISIEWALLGDVEELSFKYMGDNGEWKDSWPPESAEDDNNEIVDPMRKYNQIPSGLSFRLVHPKFGEITRIFDLPKYLEAKSIDAAEGDENSGNSDNSGSSGAAGDGQSQQVEAAGDGDA